MTDVPQKGDSTLSKIPKNAPPWSVGIVTVMVGLAGFLFTVWTLIGPQIQQRVQYQQGIETSALGTLSEMVKTNQGQIIALSEGLAESQRSNNLVSERVTSLEKQLRDTSGLLSTCELKLKNCKFK